MGAVFGVLYEPRRPLPCENPLFYMFTLTGEDKPAGMQIIRRRNNDVYRYGMVRIDVVVVQIMAVLCRNTAVAPWCLSLARARHVDFSFSTEPRIWYGNLSICPTLFSLLQLSFISTAFIFDLFRSYSSNFSYGLLPEHLNDTRVSPAPHDCSCSSSNKYLRTLQHRIALEPCRPSDLPLHMRMRSSLVENLKFLLILAHPISVLPVHFHGTRFHPCSEARETGGAVRKIQDDRAFPLHGTLTLSTDIILVTSVQSGPRRNYG